MKPTLYHIPEAASTNTWLAEKLSSLQQPLLGDGDAVVTFCQSAGRGQQGNHWESAPGMNICMSLLFCPQRIAAADSFILSEIVSIGVCRLLEGVLPVPVAVKWPNDIYVGDKKICGILIENRLSGAGIAASIAGIGLNVNQERFFSDAPNPVSIIQLTGKYHDLMELSAQLQGHVDSLYRQFEDGETTVEDIRKEYWERLYRRDGWYPFKDSRHGVFQARIHSVDAQGFLTLQTKEDGSLCRYAFKEVGYLLKPE